MANRLKEIALALQSYNDLKARVADRRSNWETATKALIEATLSQIATETDAAWNASTNDFSSNYQAVAISFPIEPSGIVKRSHPMAAHPKVKHFMRRGGALHFSLLANGQIASWIALSYIKDFHPTPAMEQLSLVEPEDVTVEFIQDEVIRFLRRLAEHEDSINDEAEGARQMTIAGFSAGGDADPIEGE